MGLSNTEPLLLFSISILFFITGAVSLVEAGTEKRWAVCYHDEIDPKDLQEYELLVLDSEYHPPLAALTGEHRTVLGYLSLGEVEKMRPHYSAVKDLLFDENPNWKDSYFVDIRDRRWMQLVIEELIPAILLQGFDGLFFDTMDNPLYLEEKDPELYKGMRAAAVRMLRAIRMHYPGIPIMINRAYGLFPDIGSQVDMVLGESIYADYNFKEKKYQKVETLEYQHQVELLKGMKREFPRLEIFTLDYWNPSDKQEISSIYELERANGFHPYVSTIDLKSVVSEPF